MLNLLKRLMSIESRLSLPQQVEIGAVQEQQAHGLSRIPFKSIVSRTHERNSSPNLSPGRLVNSSGGSGRCPSG
ncbi:hypothetical protein SynBIOSU31_00656 [Synechococcus sp. BIOS-U3-1]|nr:hypothetical protein SynBIOSU31_00656 [Synechococcus sp. BIOS-U3-1]